MDIRQLTRLGKVAGVPGVALGAVVLLLGGVLAAADALPDGWRGPVVIAVAIGAVLLGAFVTISVGQVARTSGAASIASNEDGSKASAFQYASTRGKNSPAINRRE
jgi:hypothetical protein